MSERVAPRIGGNHAEKSGIGPSRGPDRYAACRRTARRRPNRRRGPAARGRGKPTTFLLVHGAWHGGWCWDQVSARLTALGHVVIAPTLTGVCERSHLLIPSVNLTTHIDDIAGEIRFKDPSNIVLCSHSYGGVAERYADRIVLGHVIVQRLRQQQRLPPVFPFDKALHRRPQGCCVDARF
jgi:hypothetical protein